MWVTSDVTDDAPKDRECAAPRTFFSNSLNLSHTLNNSLLSVSVANSLARSLKVSVVTVLPFVSVILFFFVFLLVEWFVWRS